MPLFADGEGNAANLLAELDRVQSRSDAREIRTARPWLYDLCKNLPEPVQKRGKARPQLCLSDIVFSSVTKIYSTISGRRYETDLREAKARGYLTHLPHYNSVFKYLESEMLTPYHYELIKLSAAPLKSIDLNFAVDSSGFSTRLFMRWLDVNYGTKEDHRVQPQSHQRKQSGQHRNQLTNCSCKS